MFAVDSEGVFKVSVFKYVVLHTLFSYQDLKVVCACYHVRGKVHPEQVAGPSLVFSDAV